MRRLSAYLGDCMKRRFAPGYYGKILISLSSLAQCTSKQSNIMFERRNHSKYNESEWTTRTRFDSIVFLVLRELYTVQAIILSYNEVWRMRQQITKFLFIIHIYVLLFWVVEIELLFVDCGPDVSTSAIWCNLFLNNKYGYTYSIEIYVFHVTFSDRDLCGWCHENSLFKKWLTDDVSAISINFFSLCNERYQNICWQILLDYCFRCWVEFTAHFTYIYNYILLRCRSLMCNEGDA